MTDERHDNPNSNGNSADALERDLMISRILDGLAHETELDAFARDAADNPGAFRALAASQRDRALLDVAVADELAAAERVTLPNVADTAVEESRDARTTPVIHTIRPALAYVGWAAAIVMAFVVFATRPDPVPRPNVQLVDLEAIQQHILDERLLEQMSPVLLISEQLPDGRWRWRWIDRRRLEVITDDFQPGWVQEGHAEEIDVPPVQ